jgi:octaprenyl-diphosphate synthase
MTAAASPRTLNNIYRDIRGDLEAVERHLKEIGRSSNPLIAEVNKYLFRKRGKRIRPALLLLCAKLSGYRGQDHMFWSALVEIVHTASLIHDDIVDNATLRRGRDTVHVKWGPNITVLLGDFLYIQSIALALRTRQDRIINILAGVAAQMIEGELIEYSLSGRVDVTEDLYLEVVSKKTASLFAASCRIGGVLAGIPAEDEERLAGFGADLGLAFQIVDDVLDFTADERTLGKPVLSDLREGRVTLPVIHALGRVRGEERADLQRLVASRGTDRAAKKKILRIVADTGGLEYAADRATGFARAAGDRLAAFPSSAPRAALERMTELVLVRKA